jgi:hypothetical protein
LLLGYGLIAAPLPVGENGACSLKEGPSGAHPLLGWIPLSRRISGKREPEGVASEEVGPGSLIETSAPPGSFILGSGEDAGGADERRHLGDAGHGDASCPARRRIFSGRQNCCATRRRSGLG